MQFAYADESPPDAEGGPKSHSVPERHIHFHKEFLVTAAPLLVDTEAIRYLHVVLK